MGTLAASATFSTVAGALNEHQSLAPSSSLPAATACCTANRTLHFPKPPALCTWLILFVLQPQGQEDALYQPPKVNPKP